MSTTDRHLRLRPEDVPAVVADACFSTSDGSDGQSVTAQPGYIGLEAELLALDRPPGGPFQRVSLDRVTSVLDAVSGPDREVLVREDGRDGTFRYPLAAGGNLTFEPGAQIEISGPCQPTAAAALEHLESTASLLAAAFADQGIALASAGVDVWTAGDVAQQLRAPRYPAMAAYFDKRSAWGPVMMRNTCSLQVNLDLGEGSIARDRYAVALLASPLTVAAFACSPEAPGSRRLASRRATAWRHLDPTRTGVPAAFAMGERDPVTVMSRAALDADVLLVRGEAGDAMSGTPGWTFGAWLTSGHPDHGWPSESDLRYHLTTLFHEARPRRAVEMRGIDALPPRWRSVPVTLLAGLLYDDEARVRATTILEPHRSSLADLLARASRTGLADPATCALAVEVWSFALEGARRLPAGYVRAEDLRTAERFIDRYTTRGRSPTDELRELVRQDPGLALAWASDPVPTRAEARP